MEKENDFPIKGRYVVLLWLAPFIYLPGLDFIWGLLDPLDEWYWFDITYYYYFHSICAVVIASLVLSSKLNWRKMVERSKLSSYPSALKLTAFIFVFSMAASYALYYPLSFIFPEFVTYWFIDLSPLIFFSQGTYPIVPNFLGLVTLTVLAPIIEEITFRGFLLHRWSAKWNKTRAILFSSLLFGLLHPDPIGAFAFGVAMSIVYLRTQTLIVPIVCHSLYNLVVWFIYVGYEAVEGPYYVYTLSDFQSEWWLGVIFGVIAIFWAYKFTRSYKGQVVWRLPEV